MEWQPIETAPKDGTVIDLFHKEYGRMTDTWWDDDCWISTGTVEGYTHWMEIIPPGQTEILSVIACTVCAKPRKDKEGIFITPCPHCGDDIPF